MSDDDSGPSFYNVDPGEDLGVLVVIAGLCMFYMAWGIGANDCANNFGTSWGSGALSVKACLLIAAVCEFSGAVFLGSDVTKTFRKGIANIKLYDGNDGRVLVMVGMTCVLISAATWLLLCSRFGVPVSTTHSAVGGVMAFAIITKGYDAVVWWPESGEFGGVGGIVLSWFTSPLLALLCAWALYVALRKWILSLGVERSFDRSVKVLPVMVFVTASVIALFVVYKGGKGVGLNDTSLDVALGVSFGIGAVLGILSLPIANIIKARLMEICSAEQAKALEQGQVNDQNVSKEGVHASAAEEIKVTLKDQSEGDLASPNELDTAVGPMSKTERLFCGFTWITASFKALAHGGNDVANSVGPFGAVLAAEEGTLSKQSSIPVWVFLIAGAGICFGLGTFGMNVMTTIGKRVTPMRPSKAFAAELSSTFVILLATKLGIPISTTHASVGAIMGVGIAESGWRDGLDWRLLSKIFLSWFLTIPAVGFTVAATYSFVLPMVVYSPIV